MPEGTIKKVTDKGFGFISTADGGDIFFHMSNLDGVRFDELREGQRVTYTVGQGPKGQRGKRPHRLILESHLTSNREPTSGRLTAFFEKATNSLASCVTTDKFSPPRTPWRIVIAKNQNTYAKRSPEKEKKRRQKMR